jgi:hypothetical protein
MRAYLHRLVFSGQSGGYARTFKSPGSWDATTRLGQAENVGMLATLIEDSDVSVRAVAAAGLASLVAAGQGGALAVSALRRAAGESGVLVPLNIADVLCRAENRSSEAQHLLSDLGAHPSARVRSLAAGHT